MATKAVKPKKCRACKAAFMPVRPLQRCCSPLCALDLARSKREKAEAQAKKAERAADRVKREKLKTIPKLIAEAQFAFNAFIRERDREKLCICCGRPLGAADVGGGFDCGHYRSRGSAPHLRFDERNAHGQTKACNRYGAGRAVDYRIGLVARIGREAVEALESDNRVHKWTREELTGIKEKYAARLRQMKRDQA